MNSVKRLRYLFRRDAVELYRPVSVIYAAGAGAILLISLIVCLFGNVDPTRAFIRGGGDGHVKVFSLLLFVGGAIITSRAFSEVHNRVKNHEWFMLPAATWEKFATRLLLSSVGYSIALLIGYFFATAISAGLTLAVTGLHTGVFDPTGREALRMVAEYFVVQSVFLFGSALFRKNHFVKTVLSIIVLIIAFGLFAGVVFRLVFAGYFDGMNPTDELQRLLESLGNRIAWAGRFGNLERIARVVSEIIHWAIIAPLFWAMTYFRLREAEVSHGV